MGNQVSAEESTTDFTIDLRMPYDNDNQAYSDDSDDEVETQDSHLMSSPLEPVSFVDRLDKGKGKGKKGKKDKSQILSAPTIDAVAEYIKNNNVKDIIVMTGAGISTAAGIPDFRSPGTGLYDNLQRFKLPYPEAIFDIDFFQGTPEPFFALAKELFPGRYLPTKTHYFLSLLHRHGILLRNFTQNIENLERLAGLPGDKIVEAHGSFAGAKCIICSTSADIELVRASIMNDQIPRCQRFDNLHLEACNGIVKPTITFFGESLPERFHMQLKDFHEADLLIVIGTSLQVQPFASLIDRVGERIPRLLINREITGMAALPVVGLDLKGKYQKYRRDAAFLGDCDGGVEKLAELLGWKNELEQLYEEGHKTLKAEWAARNLTTVPINPIATTAEATSLQTEEELEKLAEELSNKLQVKEASTTDRKDAATQEEPILESAGKDKDVKEDNVKEDIQKEEITETEQVLEKKDDSEALILEKL